MNACAGLAAESNASRSALRDLRERLRSHLRTIPRPDPSGNRLLLVARDTSGNRRTRNTSCSPCMPLSNLLDLRSPFAPSRDLPASHDQRRPSLPCGLAVLARRVLADEHLHRRLRESARQISLDAQGAYVQNTGFPPAARSQESHCRRRYSEAEPLRFPVEGQLIARRRA